LDQQWFTSISEAPGMVAAIAARDCTNDELRHLAHRREAVGTSGCVSFIASRAR